MSEREHLVNSTCSIGNILYKEHVLQGTSSVVPTSVYMLKKGVLRRGKGVGVWLGGRRGWGRPVV